MIFITPNDLLDIKPVVLLLIRYLNVILVLEGQCIDIKVVQALHNHCDVLTLVKHIDIVPLKSTEFHSQPRNLFHVKL